MRKSFLKYLLQGSIQKMLISTLPLDETSIIFLEQTIYKMNDRITTFAESLFMFWQYPFLLLWVMGMSGHKIWFYFRTHTHTDLDQKQLAADYTIQSDIYVYLFSLLEAIGISQKNELWGLHRSLSFCKPFYFLQYHTLCNVHKVMPMWWWLWLH